MFKSKIMPSIEDVKHLKIPLQDISLATNGFAKENLIGKGGFGWVYKGISKKHSHIAVKRLERGQGQGDREFMTEIALLSKYKHENIASLLGFCDEDGEKILVYRFESNGSLSKQLNNKDLTWIQRLHICIDVARGLKYLHDDVGTQHRILHRDVKSSNILLDENWKPKISDFGLARVGPANMKSSFVISTPCGTPGYVDPDYYINGYLTPKSDVYSFGVVLWEVLCGRLANVIDKDEHIFLSQLVLRHYIRKTLDTIILSSLQGQINTSSLVKFSNIAYQCLQSVEERPKMEEVVVQLQKALHNQLEGNKEEREGKPTTGDERKGVNSKDPPKSPTRQEIVLSLFMHCEDCAREVKRCLKGFEGVEDVVTDCETRKVIVKGEKADPLKVLERVKKKNNRQVELLSPVPKPPSKPVPEEPSKREEKVYEEVKNMEEGEKAVEEAKSPVGDEEMKELSKDLLPPPPSQEIVLHVSMHCENCARKVQRCLEGFEGIEGVSTDCETHKVVVKGKKADPLKVLERVKKKCHPKAELISPVQKPLTDEPKKTGQEKPLKQGWKSWLQTLLE